MKQIEQLIDDIYDEHPDPAKASEDVAECFIEVLKELPGSAAQNAKLELEIALGDLLDEARNSDIPPVDALYGLMAVDGIGKELAKSLHIAGYQSRDDLKAASQADLQEVDGLGMEEAGRIKSEVGGVRDKHLRKQKSANEVSDEEVHTGHSLPEKPENERVTIELPSVLNSLNGSRVESFLYRHENFGDEAVVEIYSHEQSAVAVVLTPDDGLHQEKAHFTGETAREVSEKADHHLVMEGYEYAGQAEPVE